ncbi:MAG: SRPBCC family protein [Egibacteraceae bacterium]
MARIEAATHIEAPPARVWQVLIDWEGQARWMQDAEQVEVISERREGVGVVIRAKTDLFGLTIDDDMEVTEWEPERVLGVRHLGRIIQGVGAFELVPTSYGVHFTWWEEVDPPLGPVGELGAQLVVVPLIERVFRRSLAGLKRVAESRSVRP